MKLTEVIAKNCRCDQVEARQIAIDAGYTTQESQNQEAIQIGDCPDGNNRAPVYYLELTDGYHISAYCGEIYAEQLPEEFRGQRITYKKKIKKKETGK